MHHIHLQEQNLSRTTTNGTAVYCVNCPMCVVVLGRVDTKHHLGIGIKDGVVCFSRCLRCGSKVPVSIANTVPPTPAYLSRPPPDAPSDGAKGAVVKIRETGVLSPPVQLFDALRQSYGIWKGLSIEELAEGELHLHPCDVSKGYMPYLSQGFEWFQIRKIGNTPPKVLTIGPAGPATLPNRDPEARQVIVEGWADGVAIPYPYAPTVLLGTSNAKRCRIRSGCIVATDGDAAGRQAATLLLRAGLREGRTMYYAPLPTGKDPADLGRMKMLRLLKDPIKVTNLSGLFEISKEEEDTDLKT